MAQVRRREQGVQYDFEAIVEDFWNDAGHERTADLQAGVRIHFDEVETEVFIDHEVVPEELECVLESVWIDLVERCLESVRY